MEIDNNLHIVLIVLLCANVDVCWVSIDFKNNDD